MNIIIPVITIWALLVIVLAFINIKYSVWAYIAYLILVPNMQLNVFGVQLSYNLVNIAIICSYLLKFGICNQNSKNGKSVLDFSIVTPFLFLFLSLLLLSMFADVLPFNVQFNNIRVAFLRTCIVPFVFWNIAKHDPEFVSNTKKVLIISMIIAGIYALYLIKLNGSNPYASFLANYFGNIDIAEAYTVFNTRLSFSSAAKIQSTMVHPMTYAFVLCFSILIISRDLLIARKKIYLPILMLFAFNLLISGVRTGIAALIIGCIYIIIASRKLKLLLLGIIVVSIFYCVIKLDSDVNAIFASMIDVSGEYDMHGSSIPMRLNQFDGTIAEIQQNGFWVGKGYGWTNYYIKTYGIHPVIASFESLIFYVLLNSGVLGVICWSIFFLLIFRNNRKYITSKQDAFILDAYTIIYIFYAIVTGEYGYLAFFSMFYTLLYADLFSKNKLRVGYDK
jgi:hypothetical protein